MKKAIIKKNVEHQGGNDPLWLQTEWQIIEKKFSGRNRWCYYKRTNGTNEI